MSICLGEKIKNGEAVIFIDGKMKYIGIYNTPEEGAQADNDAAIKFHGEFARLNIIPDKEKT